MNVSIIIPAYNEEKDISDCLKSLQKQIFKKFEIIIVDDGSKDNTLNVVKNFAKKDKRIKIILGEHKGPGFSRNLGARKAKGEILIFVDADMTFDKDYIKNLINPLIKSKNLLGTTHELEIVNNLDNIWSRCWGKIRVSKESSPDVKIFRAIRRKEFLNLGGFDPKYGYADDQTLWFKYKIKPIPAKNTICYHKNPHTLKSVYKQSSWIGSSMELPLISFPVIRFFSPIILYLISPFVITFFSVRKCIRLKSLNILHYMWIFMFFRYFGTIKGIIKKIYFDKNYR